MNVLVTGGCGYIGSHTVVELLGGGHEVTVVDDFSNSSPPVVDRIKEICGDRRGSLSVHEADIRDAERIEGILRERAVDAVIHFAGRKGVRESSAIPLEYFDSNVAGSVSLLRAMRAAGVSRMVFSSSATVYAADNPSPYREGMPLAAVDPYGRTKLMIEDILRDLSRADERWRFMLLRYFNPAGAHPSGLIGEDPKGEPNNLAPWITQVAVGRRERLEIFGSDYPTRDGTCERDYLHVCDLARAHALALGKLDEIRGAEEVNLGSGRAHSVLEMVAAFGKATGREIPHEFAERRQGDRASFWADPGKAEGLLGWRAERDLDEIALDAWRWQSKNPGGYQTYA